MEDIYRLSLTVAGLIDVQANSAKEALEIAQTALKRGGLTLAGKQVLNVSAALNPVVKIDSTPLKMTEPAVIASQRPKRIDDHQIEVHDVQLDIKTLN